MIAAVTLMLCLAGFAVLCTTLARHERDLLGRALAAAAKRRLRALGYGLLALAYAVALWRHGFGYGTVVWCGLLSVAAATVVCALTLRASQAERARRR